MANIRRGENYTVQPIPMNDAWDTSSNASSSDSLANFSPFRVTSEERSSSSSVRSFSSSTTASDWSHYSNASNRTSVMGKELKNLEPKIFDKTLWYCNRCPRLGPYFLRQRPCSVPPRGVDYGTIGGVRKPSTFGQQRNSVCSESGFHTATHLTHLDLTGLLNESRTSSGTGSNSTRSLFPR